MKIHFFFLFHFRVGSEIHQTAQLHMSAVEGMKIWEFKKEKGSHGFWVRLSFILRTQNDNKKNLLKISIPSVQNLIIICIELLKCFISCQSFLVNLYCKSNSIEAGGEIFIVKQYFPLLAKHWFQGCFINTFHRWFFKM